MRLPRLRHALTAIAILSGVVLMHQDGSTQSANAQAPDAAVDKVAESIKKINEQDNGLTINRKGKHVDVKAEVCLREAEFLEMFVCTRDTREHESILVTDTPPSLMHVGLLLLGAEPGEPLRYDRDTDPPTMIAATGPEVEVYVVLKVAGQEREVPANRWIKDNGNDKMMQGNTWLFAGSVTTALEGKQVYLADLNGSAVSLVNFGDDLLTLPNKMTQDNNSHGKVWAPRTNAIPKVGTEVTLRLKLKAEKKDKKPAENP